MAVLTLGRLAGLLNSAAFLGRRGSGRGFHRRRRAGARVRLSHGVGASGTTRGLNSASGGLQLVIVLVVQQDVSFLVQTAVGVILELARLAAVNVPEPITDQSDLVEQL